MNTSLTNKTLTAATVAMVCMTLALPGTASAALVATDLNTGGTDTGFSGGWLGSSNVFITNDGDLAYTNYGITQSGTPGNVYACDTTHTDRMDSRNLAAAMSGEIWFTSLVSVPSAGNFGGLAFDSDLTTGGAERYSHTLSELRVLLTPSELIVDLDGGALPTSGTGSFAADTTHLLLGYMNLASGNDTLEVWVDPDLTQPLVSTDDLPTADFTSTAVDFADSIQRIGTPLSWNDSVNSPYVDAIWLSDTVTAFEDVTGVEFVPEPSTAILAMLGLAGIFLRRRPRK